MSRPVPNPVIREAPHRKGVVDDIEASYTKVKDNDKQNKQRKAEECEAAAAESYLLNNLRSYN